MRYISEALQVIAIFTFVGFMFYLTRNPHVMWFLLFLLFTTYSSNKN